MQKKNVIDQHPDVVAKMRKPLYEWWEGVKDLANEVQNAAIVGTQYENPTKLSATEWLDVFVDTGTNPKGRTEERLLANRCGQGGGVRDRA